MGNVVPNMQSPVSAKVPLIFDACKLDITRLPRVDCHLHTSWTDGKATVSEIYDRANEIGLEAILYSEHSRKTSIEWFYKFADEVRSLPVSTCHAYIGTECKIENLDGEIDTVPEISSLCDFVMASVHRFPDAKGRSIPFEEVSPQEAIDREFSIAWAALENPIVNILGHIFGMTYNRFKVHPPAEKLQALIARASEYGVAIEINSHYHPNPLQLIKWCQEFNTRITFGSNAHTLEAVGKKWPPMAEESEL